MRVLLVVPAMLALATSGCLDALLEQYANPDGALAPESVAASEAPAPAFNESQWLRENVGQPAQFNMTGSGWSMSSGSGTLGITHSKISFGRESIVCVIQDLRTVDCTWTANWTASGGSSVASTRTDASVNGRPAMACAVTFGDCGRSGAAKQDGPATSNETSVTLYMFGQATTYTTPVAVGSSYYSMKSTRDLVVTFDDAGHPVREDNVVRVDSELRPTH